MHGGLGVQLPWDRVGDLSWWHQGGDGPQMWLEKVAAARALQTPALLEILLTWPQKRSFCSEVGAQTLGPVLQPKVNPVVRIRRERALEMLS